MTFRNLPLGVMHYLTLETTHTASEKEPILLVYIRKFAPFSVTWGHYGRLLDGGRETNAKNEKGRHETTASAR